MKRILTTFATLALLLNLYQLGAWTYAYCSTNVLDQATAKFAIFLPAWLSINVLAIVGLLITIISMIIFARYKTAKNHSTFTSGIIIQAAFLLLYTWQQL